ncbi:Ovate protein family C-terminal [Arabidopsis thaliana x Arabidopsis arenosa]|uniref:Transcription repressor n=1 Tax=Arabidopsis thaliana x Arabidopsis arenosa TaxID=1240361 RepID=A0A8T1ZQW2_9BRAS|nr:Ovate protein family C-terminal [Arabidopsis thaliana x Arabidopsis arenosa]
MAAKSKKKILKTVSVVDISCGNCIKPTFSSIFNFFSKKPKRPSSNYRHCHSSISSATPSSTPLATAAVAVEKDSDDPYLDFRQSMLQMILENQIYSKDELRELFSASSASIHTIITASSFVLSRKYGKTFPPPPLPPSKRPLSSTVMCHVRHVITITITRLINENK